MIGLRQGYGFKLRDSFDFHLQKFTSTLRTDVYSKTNYNYPQINQNQEIFLKHKTPFSSYDSSYNGVVLGNMIWENFTLQNITSEPFFTNLNFSLFSQFISFTYHYLWFLKKTSIEVGGGFGFNQVFWKTNGQSTDFSELIRQNGVMIGSGLNYRFEFLMNRSVSLRNSLQIGFIAHHTFIPQLTGTFNGQSASFFVNNKGQVIPLIESSNKNNFIHSESYVRRIGISSTSFLYTFSLFRKFKL